MSSKKKHPAPKNKAIKFEGPMLTVTVRAAFFNPMSVLPDPEDKKPIDTNDKLIGREMWGGQGVSATFELSTAPVTDQAVSFAPVLDPTVDNPDPVKNRIHTKTGRVKSGICYTDVYYSKARHAVTREKTGDDGKKKNVRVVRTILWDGNDPSTNDKKVAKGIEVGRAKVPIPGLVKGDHILRIIPDDLTQPPEPVGPTTQIGKTQYTYRPLFIQLTIGEDHRLEKAVTCVLDAASKVVPNPEPINHGYVTAWSATELAVDIKPDVVKGERAGQGGRGGHEIDMIVVHGTGGALMGPDVNTGKQKIGPTYEIDLDGHTVKFTDDADKTNHAGPSNFCFDPLVEPKGDTPLPKNGYTRDINQRALGIEVVGEEGTLLGRGQDDYTDAQMKALLRILSLYPKVARWRIVGHCDVKCITPDSKSGTGDKNKLWGMDDDRKSCPGRAMDWPRLEREGYGRPSQRIALGVEHYSGLFVITPTAVIREGDNDEKRRWGGKNYEDPKMSGVILELQKDLRMMGYSLLLSGSFDAITQKAVTHFIMHTFSGERRKAPEPPPGEPKDKQRGWVQTGNDVGAEVPIWVAEYIKGTALATGALIDAEKKKLDEEKAKEPPKSDPGKAKDKHKKKKDSHPPPKPEKHAELMDEEARSPDPDEAYDRHDHPWLDEAEEEGAA